jgi:bacillithiol biosynthesis cysteine-adding enzyme BshC
VHLVKAPLVITEPLGGSSLARAAIAGTAPDGWYVPQPRSGADWRRRSDEVRASANDQWLDALRPAFGATGHAAARLETVGGGKGVVVTTGQQPGLFGGPVYTWSKALSAIALADALQAATGVPVAPVFWAATDDSDFAEASWTMVARAGGVDELRMPTDDTGHSMAAVPLGNVASLIDRLERGAGSAVWREPLLAVRRCYREGQTVGTAYLELLRSILEPLGMAVLDAAHPAVRRAGFPLMQEALRKSESVAEAVGRRDRAMLDAGHPAQVASVEGLSLVFRTDGRERKRITHADAVAAADAADAGMLSANVLLRPIVERAILPTVAYVAGPAEIAYFAQVSAVAGALEAEVPLAVPRWSCTILEPHVADVLERLQLERDELRDPHAADTRVAKAGLPDSVTAAVTRMSDAVATAMDTLGREESGLVPAQAVEGARRAITARIARLERRYTAAMKRKLDDVLREIATARGSLFPAGKRQERALNLIPLLARHGRPLLDEMQAAASVHAAGLVDASREAAVRTDRLEAPSTSA